MNEQNYKQTLDEARKELANAIGQRDYWNLQIVRLQDLVRALSSLVSDHEKLKEYDAEIQKYVDIMQAVEAVINRADHHLTPLNVREQLVFYGYDLSHFANPMAMIHQTLKRLTAQGRTRLLRDGLYGKVAALDLK